MNKHYETSPEKIKDIYDKAQNAIFPLNGASKEEAVHIEHLCTEEYEVLYIDVLDSYFVIGKKERKFGGILLEKAQSDSVREKLHSREIAKAFYESTLRNR